MVIVFDFRQVAFTGFALQPHPDPLTPRPTPFRQMNCLPRLLCCQAQLVLVRVVGRIKVCSGDEIGLGPAFGCGLRREKCTSGLYFQDLLAMRHYSRGDHPLLNPLRSLRRLIPLGLFGVPQAFQLRRTTLLRACHAQPRPLSGRFIALRRPVDPRAPGCVTNYHPHL
jgi:hypothetical protein